MKHPFLFILTVIAIMISSCTKRSQMIITEPTVQACAQKITSEHPNVDQEHLSRGLHHAARMWEESDGTEHDFFKFMTTHYYEGEERDAVFASLSRMIEKMSESADMLSVELLRPVTLTNAGMPTEIDYIMSGFSANAHFSDELFKNKVAFISILNFPAYTLAEKNKFGREWTRQQWAEARLGDIFSERLPADKVANMSKAFADAENYIADYNIYMGSIRTEDNRQLWPDNMILLSHWNLRDELKANYAGNQTEKQEMIYTIMQRIVRQEIPQAVINNGDHVWYPISNRCDQDEHENNVRYQKILDCFHAMLEVDPYCHLMPTGIARNFDGDLELSAEEVEELFTSLLSSNQVKEVGAIIRERLGRDLRPYDIWYDGFKSRSTLNEDNLTTQTRKLYPNPDAYEQQIPAMLQKLGWTAENAKEVASHIKVEPARGSGHAWPCLGKNEPALLRTRIAPEGMDYKGYNIAVHEMGHNVEEVTSLYLMDYYMLHGIPNTGFTEASAFLFQQRDLQLLGYGRSQMDKDKMLDIFWGMYEIMGVSLVDMYMWRWLYAHQNATAIQLKHEVESIAAEVWNKYYYPVLGEKDCIILGIYSHMVNSPMYLPNYPIGHIIQFQLEQYLRDMNDQQFATEYTRIYRQGRLTPNIWMEGAVGGKISVEPVLNAVSECIAK